MDASISWSGVGVFSPRWHHVSICCWVLLPNGGWLRDVYAEGRKIGRPALRQIAAAVFLLSVFVAPVASTAPIDDALAVFGHDPF